jgi:hypothetical protein
MSKFKILHNSLNAVLCAWLAEFFTDIEHSLPVNRNLNICCSPTKINIVIHILSHAIIYKNRLVIISN